MTGQRRPPVTAAELLADPAVAARQAETAAELERNQQQYARAALPVLADLRAAGYDVATVGELLTLGEPYRAAVPVLLGWLPRVDDPFVKRDIVRALAAPWSKRLVAGPLLDEFRRVGPPGNPVADVTRAAIASALDVVADASIRDDLVAIARDHRWGQARGMVVLALAKTKDPSVIDVLVEQLADDSVVWFAARALAKLKLPAPQAEPALAELSRRGDRELRKEAEKALASSRSARQQALQSD